MRLLAAFSLIVAASLLLALIATSQEAERVHPIAAPSTPLPSEAESNGVRQYSFIAYGDTRGRRDGGAAQLQPAGHAVRPVAGLLDELFDPGPGRG